MLRSRGFFTLQLSLPGAGAEIIQTVPAGELWLLHSLRAQYTADANVANREVRLVVDNVVTGEVLALFNTGVNITANQAPNLTFLKGGGYRGAGATNPSETIGIGSLIVPGGFRLRTAVQNRQAGDLWSTGLPFFTYEILG